MINKFSTDYNFLSNFYPCTVYYKGTPYPTVEHAYQAAKSTDPWHHIRISNLPWDKAGKAKRMGRRCTLRPDWEQIKNKIMEDLLRQKFDQSTLKQKLLDTGHQELVEGNYWHDNYWGDCNCDKCKNISGLNVLGILLMKLRREYYENINNR